MNTPNLVPLKNSAVTFSFMILDDHFNGQIFDYRKAPVERTEMENAIRYVTIDIKTETIKKGTPHTLRLIKTQATYER